MSPKVEDYFKESPFASIAGELSWLTGKDDFLPLRNHHTLLSQIVETFREKPISIRIVTASIGGGKTWSLSWIWRETEKGDATNHTLVVGIPWLELRRAPERALVEALLRSIHDQMDKIRPAIGTIAQSSIAALDSSDKWLLAALKNEQVFMELIGGAGRLPELDGIPAPSRSSTEGITRLLLSVFKVVRLAGYARMLILVDEAEALFLSYGHKNLILFSNFLRVLYDRFETDNGKSYPAVQIVFAGTVEVLESISPLLVGRQADESGVTAALRRRLEPVLVLVPPTIDEALKIAAYRIGEHRKKKDEPFIPYDEDAIKYVWDQSSNIIGDFCRYLQRMYERARKEGVSRITLAHGKRVIQEYGAPLSKQ